MGASGASLRRRWLSRRALLIHLALLLWVPGCGVAAWWQVGVALSGDHLGWVYAVEWPVFGVLGTVGWWQAIHDDPETVGRRGLLRARAAAAPGGSVGAPAALETPAAVAGDTGVAAERPAGAGAPGAARVSAGASGAGGTDGTSGARAEDGEDEELAAYNAYLASLAAARRPKTWRDPLGAGRR
jgi:hypothetical protein